MEVNNNGGEAEFNSGLSIIYQLDALERLMVDASLAQDFSKHYRLMVAYFKTLYPNIKKDERTAHIEKWNKIKLNLKQINDCKHSGDGQVHKEIIDEFDYWEFELRDLKQSSGMGMKKYDPRFALAGRK